MSVFRINMTAATVLAALSSPVFAAQTADLETVHIKGQRSYNAIATEKNGDYSSLKAAIMDDRLNTRVSPCRLKDKNAAEPEQPQHPLRRIGQTRDGRR